MNSFIISLLILETGALAALVFLFYKKSKKLKSLVGDISEVKDTLKEGAQSATKEKNRIFAILESMAEGVVVIDPRQKILLVNTVLNNIFGFKAGQVQGRYSWEVFRDPQINAMIEKALKEKISIKEEDTLLLSNSVFEIQVSPVLGGRDFLGVVAVFHDVTKLKKLERLRTEFVANVSHELKTPLTSIIGFVETLKAGAAEDPDTRMRFLGIIEEHSKKLNHLIEELLLLSKLESEHEALKKEGVDLGKLMEKMTLLFENVLKSRKIKLHSEMRPSPFLLSADPKSIEQAFSNLIDNAIKYNQEGGEIFVKASQDPEVTKIEIRDTGIGIPEADLPRIFERFYRVDKSRSRETGGAGLGLSIVKHIVERHSGQIHASSAKQKGATFTITLPK